MTTCITYAIIYMHISTDILLYFGPAGTHMNTYQGFIQEFVLGGGNFVSGEQWACEACLPRGVWGVCFEKVSALRLILVGFGNQALVIAPVPVNCP